MILIHLEVHALLVEAEILLVLVQLTHCVFALEVEIVVEILELGYVTSFIVEEQLLE